MGPIHLFTLLSEWRGSSPTSPIRLTPTQQSHRLATLPYYTTMRLTFFGLTTGLTGAWLIADEAPTRLRTILRIFFPRYKIEAGDLTGDPALRQQLCRNFVVTRRTVKHHPWALVTHCFFHRDVVSLVLNCRAAKSLTELCWALGVPAWETLVVGVGGGVVGALAWAWAMGYLGDGVFRSWKKMVLRNVRMLARGLLTAFGLRDMATSLLGATKDDERWRHVGGKLRDVDGRKVIVGRDERPVPMDVPSMEGGFRALMAMTSFQLCLMGTGASAHGRVLAVEGVKLLLFKRGSVLPAVAGMLASSAFGALYWVLRYDPRVRNALSNFLLHRPDWVVDKVAQSPDWFVGKLSV